MKYRDILRVRIKELSRSNFGLHIIHIITCHICHIECNIKTQKRKTKKNDQKKKVFLITKK